MGDYIGDTPLRNDPAIVVVDVQAGFINDFTRPIVGNLVRLFKDVEFKSRVFTRFSNSDVSLYRSVFSWHELSSPEQTAIVPEVEPFITSIVDKTTYAPPVGAIIDALDPGPTSDIYLAGIDTDVCVLLTAAALFDAGYRVQVLADCSMSTAGPGAQGCGTAILARIIGHQNVIADSFAHFSKARVRCID